MKLEIMKYGTILSRGSSESCLIIGRIFNFFHNFYLITPITPHKNSFEILYKRTSSVPKRIKMDSDIARLGLGGVER